uniref:Uncharacterized protein n=1 Tax=viral metagenome TaxID=1070528 RepID=A0A6C0C501_9ZZZZ
MDLTQQKLTSEEWDALERPVSKGEQRILEMIRDGYNNIDILFNDTQSLINFVKISENKDMHHQYFYEKYFKKEMDTLKKKYLTDILKVDKKKKNTNSLKKRELIRIANVDKKIDSMRKQIVEFVLLDLLKQFLKSNKKSPDDKKTYYQFYTMGQILKYDIRNVNPQVVALITNVLDHFTPKIKKNQLIKYAYELIEKNKDIHKYRDIKLYEHQKRLLTDWKTPGPKLYLYQAPTGTGKTLTPLGLVSPHNPDTDRSKKNINEKIMELSFIEEEDPAKIELVKSKIDKLQKELKNLPKKRRIVFVCAAKHVGLQLAKSCIALDIKIAVAFGCSDPAGIRLHYFAAKDFVKNRRTGGIFRVDNSVGDNVQIIISDIQSYVPAMRYMLAFNEPEELTWYWDEPTITLDYEDHKYHEILKQNWQENLIPNIILSSATLPKQEDIAPCIQSFIGKFNATNIDSILSHDCAKTIPLLDMNGFAVLPHLVYGEFSVLKESIKHIKNYQTLLRHFDLKEVTRFIIYVNKHVELKDRYKIDNYFESITDINVISIKQYYLKLLIAVKNDYTKVYDYFQSKKKAVYDSTIKLTTSDAYTLTDGPTIYMADDVKKIAKFCLKLAAIPAAVLSIIMDGITSNDLLRQEIDLIDRELMVMDNLDEPSGKKGKNTDRSQKSKKASRNTPSEMETKKKDLQRKMDGLRGNLIKIELDKEFVPNTMDHLKKFYKDEWLGRSFTPDIPESAVEKIMLLEVDAIWKVLLLMGIGVFTNHTSRDYVAIMKDLAQNQQLYLIIASTDYIYGTNYQFCHGYIGKDLKSLTQNKLIQAIGRTGRQHTNMDYSIRLRDDEFINTLFMPSTNKIEVANMNRLFA